MAEAAKKQSPPAAKETGIVPVKDKKAPTLVEAVEAELQEITSANFYQVPGKGGQMRMEPDSRALQHYANKFGGISTKIIDSGMDDTHAWAHVQAWAQKTPNLVMEDKVTIVYQLEFEGLIWNYVKEGCRRHKGGCPVVKENNRVKIVGNTPELEDPSDIMDLKLLLNRKMRFAERECITKAKSRLYKQVMNMEWRDIEEIDSEDTEVKLVSDKTPIPAEVTKTEQTTQQATTTAAQSAKTATAKKEDPKPAAAPAKATAPAATATAKAKEAVQTAFPGPEKANIPPSPFATKAAEPVHQAPSELLPSSKKNSEWFAALVGPLQTTAQVIQVFSANRLGVEVTALATKKEELTLLLFSIWKCCQKYNPSTVGSFIKGEQMSEEFKKSIGDDLLLFFATEMNKRAEGK